MKILRNRPRNTASDDDATNDRIPLIHSEEDLYPLFVRRALACDESKDNRDTPRDVLSDTDFGLLSSERAVSELQALGLPLHKQDEALSTLFPGGDALLKTYVQEVTPKLDLTSMTLEDILCHIRIASNRLHRLGVRSKKFSQELSLLHRRHGAGRGFATTAERDLL